MPTNTPELLMKRKGRKEKDIINCRSNAFRHRINQFQPMMPCLKTFAPPSPVPRTRLTLRPMIPSPPTPRSSFVGIWKLPSPLSCCLVVVSSASTLNECRISRGSGVVARRSPLRLDIHVSSVLRTRLTRITRERDNMSNCRKK